MFAQELPDGSEPSKLVVRGNVDAEWHGNSDFTLLMVFLCCLTEIVQYFSADIYEQFTDMLKVLKLDAECLGGGRIEHHPGVKKIKVYGYSQVRFVLLADSVNLTNFKFSGLWKSRSCRNQTTFA